MCVCVCVCVCVLTRFITQVRATIGLYSKTCDVAFTQYCYYQYCMVYSIQTVGRKGSRILSNKCALGYGTRVGNASGRRG